MLVGGIQRGGSPVEEGDQDAIPVSNFFSNEGSESD